MLFHSYGIYVKLPENIQPQCNHNSPILSYPWVVPMDPSLFLLHPFEGRVEWPQSQRFPGGYRIVDHCGHLEGETQKRNPWIWDFRGPRYFRDTPTYSKTKMSKDGDRSGIFGNDGTIEKNPAMMDSPLIARLDVSDLHFKALGLEAFVPPILSRQVHCWEDCR